MSLQTWQQLDVSPLEDFWQAQSDSAGKPLRLITNVPFAEKLPKTQILSYLADTGADSTDFDLYGILTTQTVNPETCLPTADPGASVPRHIITLKTPPRQGVFTSLQKWEGVVLEVTSDSFLARLTDLTQKGPDEEAEFPLDEVSPEDRSLVRPGAIFYWNIGYCDSYSGQRTRSSFIRFRRLPAWTKEEIEAAKQEAERIRRSIGWK